MWSAVSWLRRFHEHNADDLVRHLSSVYRQLDGMDLEVDASTTGCGAACWFGARRMSQQGPPNAFVATSWTEEDEQLLGVERGDPAHQATWEAFMALLAVRHFVAAAARGRIVLVGDALGVWFGLIKMAAKCTKVNEIAKELALHLAPMGHDLSGIHVWSEVNTTADALSRMAEHGQVPRNSNAHGGRFRAPSVDILECMRRKKRENAGRPRAHECPRTQVFVFFFDKMFVRYPRSVLRHDLCHKDGHTLATAKFCQTNKLGNNAGLGPPSAALREDHLKAGGGLGPRRRVQKGPALRAGFSGQEVGEKLAKQGSWQVRLQRDLVEKCEPNSPSLSDTVSVCGEWECPPSRAGAPGRKASRRGPTERELNMTSLPCLQWRR